MNHEAEKYNDLIVSFLLGETTPEEEVYLLSWKKESIENETYFNKLRDTWFATSRVKESTPFDTTKALDTLHQRIASQHSTSDKNEFSKLNVLRNYIKIAAVLIGIFVLGGLVSHYYLPDNNFEASNNVKVIAPKGSRSIAYLPDGSIVWLNAESEITYTSKSKKNREVKLIGEAFFKVKSDKKHPFIVTANGVAITALGTSFNVKAYPEEKKVTTTLVEGLVNIENHNTKVKEPFIITMRPNQKVVIYNDSSLYFQEKSTINKEIRSKKESTVSLSDKQFIPAIKAQNINTNLYTSWKDDRWIIDSEEFGNLATLLERRYNVNILFQTNELKRYRFSGTFTNETIEQALSLMRYMLPFDYIIDKNNILLKVDPVLMKSYNQAYKKRE